MLLTKFCKSTPSEYDILQNEIGYFDNEPKPAASTASQPAATTSNAKKLVYNNIPQTVEYLVSKLHKEIETLPNLTDSFGIQIRKESIEKLKSFLTANGVAF